MKVRRVLVILAVTLLAFGIATPASAWTTRVLSGRPGSSGVPVTIGDWHPTYVRLILPNRYVTRSPATAGLQHVWTTYRLLRYNWTFGRWRTELVTTDPMQTIPRGSRRAIYPGQVYNIGTQGVFAIDFWVTWRRADGSLLGRRYYWQNATTDYRCAWTDGYRCVVLNTPDGAGIFLSA